jgi:hypothetical protein
MAKAKSVISYAEGEWKRAALIQGRHYSSQQQSFPMVAVANLAIQVEDDIELATVAHNFIRAHQEMVKALKARGSFEEMVA